MTAPSPASVGQVCLASLPVESLGALAELRASPAVFVTIREGRAWVRWSRGDDRVTLTLLPIPGVRLYAAGGPPWRIVGEFLPDFDVPDDVAAAGSALHRVLVPAPFESTNAPVPSLVPARHRLVADGEPRRTTALLCTLAQLTEWAERVPARRFLALTAARSAETLIVRGEGLPEIAGARRFWGEQVLVPLGSRLEPGLREGAWHRLLGVALNSLLVVDEDGIEPVPAAAFGPITRAGFRIAAGGGRRC